MPSAKFYNAFADFVKENYPAAVQCKEEDGYAYCTDKLRIELLEDDVVETIAVYAKLGRCTPKIASALVDIVPLQYDTPISGKVFIATVLVTEKVPTGLPCEEEHLPTLVKIVEEVKRVTGLESNLKVSPEDFIIVSTLDRQDVGLVASLGFSIEYICKNPTNTFVATRSVK